ncbi:MAG: hypothetical protein EB828_05565 [Nitrosopumilus sp. D6]|nr:MAG: hypothetical protein EB828_05565 [Nitrosopumilus sp. D6]
MKILVDENLDGMDLRLKERGYDAYSVRKLTTAGENLGSDYSVINYARKHGMVIVTKDGEYKKASKENGFPLVLIDDDEILEIIIKKLGKI